MINILFISSPARVWVCVWKVSFLMMNPQWIINLSAHYFSSVCVPMDKTHGFLMDSHQWLTVTHCLLPAQHQTEPEFGFRKRIWIHSLVVLCVLNFVCQQVHHMNFRTEMLFKMYNTDYIKVWMIRKTFFKSFGPIFNQIQYTDAFFHVKTNEPFVFLNLYIHYLIYGSEFYCIRVKILLIPVLMKFHV